MNEVTCTLGPWHRCLLSTALLLALSPASAVEPSIAAPAAALPSMAQPAQAWKSFLETGTNESVNKAYEVLPLVYGAEGEITPACAALFPRIDAAIASVPVGVGLWHTGYKCAEIAGDEARTKAYGEGLAQLAAHALGQNTQLLLSPPIQVLGANDIEALIDMSGMEMRYRFIDASRMPQHYPMHVALWDAESKTERHFSFDFLDPLFRLKSGDRLDGYPAHRAAMREAFVKQQVESNYVIGLDLAAARKALGLSSSSEKIAAIRDAATKGGLLSLRAWNDTCDAAAFPGCGEGLVDALLPFAEDGLAMHRIELAVAHARGIGVRKDLDAALALVDSAEVIWGKGESIAEFGARMLGGDDKRRLPRPIVDRLVKAEAAGNRRAAFVRMLDEVRRSKTFDLPEDALALVLRLAETGQPVAGQFAAYYYEETKQPTHELIWRKKVAEAGYADAMEWYAIELLQGKRVPRDRKAAMEWMRKAADAGSGRAMYYLGQDAARHLLWKEAEAWYSSALSYDQFEAGIELAAVYAAAHEGVDGGPSNALRLHEWFEANMDRADMRRAFAGLLLENKTLRDPERARKLLLKDASTGDHDSEYMLGRAYLDGQLTSSDPEEGLRWATKSLVDDEEGIRSTDFAHWLFYKQATPAGRTRALALSRKFAEKEFAPAMNNLAWYLCTAEDAASRAPAEGLAMAKRMGDASELDGGTVDSVAACHAAVGEFDKAVELQELALTKIQEWPADAASADEMKKRLESYKRKQPYIEKAAPASAG